jgi:hypothetical protein
MNEIALLFIVTLAGKCFVESYQPKTPKEAPSYKIIGGNSQYEIRKYEEGTNSSA